MLKRRQTATEPARGSSCAAPSLLVSKSELQPTQLILLCEAPLTAPNSSSRRCLANIRFCRI